MKKFNFITALLAVSASSSFGQMLINFDDSPLGTIGAGSEISGQYGSMGVNFSLLSAPTGLDLRAFDSSNSGAWDADLATPGFGAGNDGSTWSSSPFANSGGTGADNILIIRAGYGSNGFQDDDRNGGVIGITFDAPVTFKNIGLLDMDDSSSTTISFFDASSSLISSVNVSQFGDNSYQESAFNVGGVKQVQIGLASSGAITGLEFESNVIPEPSTYALIFGGLALGVVIIRRRLGAKG